MKSAKNLPELMLATQIITFSYRYRLQ